MNTKPIPIIITLIAAFISCIASVIQRVSFDIFTKRLLLAVICFAIIGIIVRVVIERSFKTMEEENDQEKEETEEEVETADEETQKEE